MDEVTVRVNTEHNELNEKIEKLRAFVATEKFANLTQEHRDLLSKQLGYMRAYSEVLAKRLRLLNSTHEDINWEEWEAAPEPQAFHPTEEHTSGLSVDWVDGFRVVETFEDL